MKKLRRCSHKNRNGSTAWRAVDNPPGVYQVCGLCYEKQYSPDYLANMSTDGVAVYHGMCGDILRDFASDSVDAMITDPPSGTDFMDQKWDSDKGGRDAWIATRAAEFKEAYRVMKPGAYAYVWAFPRTSHWTILALEDAGFVLRDTMHHLFATGVPMSLDLQKEAARKIGPVNAAKYEGIGTGLKPAIEYWLRVQKPREGTYADNLLTWGTGGIDVDATRIPFAPGEKVTSASPLGRWPANVLISHTLFCTPGACVDGCPAKDLDDQSPKLASMFNQLWPDQDDDPGLPVVYFAKPTRAEKERGLDNLPGKTAATLTKRDVNSAGIRNPRASKRASGEIKNIHPTIKPLGLIRFLTKQITPRPIPGEAPPCVLDMYAGSGPLGIIAIELGLDAILIEADTENEGYIAIIKARLADATARTKGKIAA